MQDGICHFDSKNYTFKRAYSVEYWSSLLYSFPWPVIILILPESLLKYESILFEVTQPGRYILQSEMKIANRPITIKMSANRFVTPRSPHLGRAGKPRYSSYDCESSFDCSLSLSLSRDDLRATCVRSKGYGDGNAAVIVP